MEFTVRAAVPDDGAAISRIRVQSWRETYPHILSPAFLAELDPEGMAAYWHGLIESGRVSVAVVESGGTVTGFAVVGTSSEDDAPRDLVVGLIYQLAVMHGSGSGQALLDATLGDRPAYLWVAQDNPRAIAFYRRNGFEPDDAAKEDPDWENLAEIRMVR